MSVTENQLNYIKILSSYDYSHEEDKQDIIDFLEQNVKDELSKLSKKEASDLIQLLLERPTGHLLPCDTVIVLDKREVNSFHILGDTEAADFNGVKVFKIRKSRVGRVHSEVAGVSLVSSGCIGR